MPRPEPTSYQHECTLRFADLRHGSTYRCDHCKRLFHGLWDNQEPKLRIVHWDPCSTPPGDVH